MVKFRVITDSSSGISQEDAKKLGVVVLPLTLSYKGKDYLDGIDITTDEFYKMVFEEEKKEGLLQQVKSHFKANNPIKTSMVTPVAFENAMKDVLKDVENGSFVDFHFAIMEVEAWFLGIPGFTEKLDERLTREYVQQNVGIDLETDPEKMVFHPAAELGKIYALAGKQYDKHASDVSAIMSQLTPDDFLKLIGSGKCQTFKAFAESLLGVTIDRIESL